MACLLSGVNVERPNQAWSSDTIYIPMGKHGFMYLAAVVDWYSRNILSWELSNSRDGRGRAMDNIFERLWRTVKY